MFISYILNNNTNSRFLNFHLYDKVNVPVYEHIPVCRHLFIFFSINISNDKKLYNNLYKHYFGKKNKIDMNCRC